MHMHTRLVSEFCLPGLLLLAATWLLHAAYACVCAAPSMSHYLNQTSKVILDKYSGDLDNLRKEAEHDPVKERELVKAFKVKFAVTHHAAYA